MIFSSRHIELIKKRLKIQTRRKSDRLQIGKTYSIQPCRTCKGISAGRILILTKREEKLGKMISKNDAKAEGDYTPRSYEELYLKMYPNWKSRWVYTFKFVSVN